MFDLASEPTRILTALHERDYALPPLKEVLASEGYRFDALSFESGDAGPRAEPAAASTVVALHPARAGSCLRCSLRLADFR